LLRRAIARAELMSCGVIDAARRMHACERFADDQRCAVIVAMQQYFKWKQ